MVVCDLLHYLTVSSSDINASYVILSVTVSRMSCVCEYVCLRAVGSPVYAASLLGRSNLNSGLPATDPSRIDPPPSHLHPLRHIQGGGGATLLESPKLQFFLLESFGALELTVLNFTTRHENFAHS